MDDEELEMLYEDGGTMFYEDGNTMIYESESRLRWTDRDPTTGTWIERERV